MVPDTSLAGPVRVGDECVAVEARARSSVVKANIKRILRLFEQMHLSAHLHLLALLN